MSSRHNNQVNEILAQWDFDTAALAKERIELLESRASSPHTRNRSLSHTSIVSTTGSPQLPKLSRPMSSHLHRLRSSIIHGFPIFDESRPLSIANTAGDDISSAGYSRVPSALDSQKVEPQNTTRPTAASVFSSQGIGFQDAPHPTFETPDITCTPRQLSMNESLSSYSKPNDEAKLEVLDFVIDGREEILLLVKLHDGTISSMAEGIVQHISEDALFDFWQSRGSREGATGLGKRTVYRVLGYRSLFNEAYDRNEFWVHWTGYPASQGSWVEADLVRAVAREKVQDFSAQRRLSFHRGLRGEMFARKEAPSCVGSSAGTCAGCMGCGLGCH